MKVVWILIALCGVWLIASSVTEKGLLPSGHGMGWISELILGLAAVGYASFRLIHHARRRHAQ